MRTGQHGFTLIEVLAALTVTALVVSTLFPSFNMLMTRWALGQKAVQANDQWMQATLRLTEDLAGALPLAVGDDKQTTLAFELDPLSVVFVRPGLGTASKNHLQTVTLRIEQSKEGDRLTRSAADFDKNQFPAQGGTPAPLLSGPFRLRFTAVNEQGSQLEGLSYPSELPPRVVLNVEPLGPNTTLPPAPIAMPIAARFSPLQQQSNKPQSGNPADRFLNPPGQ